MRIENELLNDVMGLSDDDLESFGGATRDEVYKFIRLTHLIPELMDAADAGAMGIDSGVAISFIGAENQRAIWDYFFQKNRIPIDVKIARALDEADELGVIFNDDTLKRIVENYSDPELHPISLI